MSTEPVIPRKWMLRAHDQRIVLSKHPNESARHVIMKGLLWALYLPQYPTLTVEIRIGDRYKPDLVAFDPQPNIYAAAQPLFWGESGMVSQAKIESLVRRYPDTHFALAKWDSDLRPHVAMVSEVLEKIRGKRTASHAPSRLAPFDLLRFPADSLSRFVDSDGIAHITHAALEWLSL